MEEKINQQENMKQQNQIEPKKEQRFLNWKKYLYNENVLTEVLKFEQWNKEDIQFQEAGVLQKDLTRTRAKDPFFKKEKTQLKLQQITTFYCKQHFVNYQQGMLELVIPFLLLQSKEFKLSKCYAYFSSFMENYFPKFLIQKPLNNTIELPHLTSSIHFCEILLSYHNPRILQIFKEADLNLSLAITQWIITLFAKDTEIPLVYIIFDNFMKKKSPLFIFYLVISLIQSNEEKINQMMEEDEDELIFYFNKGLKNFTNEDQINQWFEDAQKLRDQTPKSYEKHLLSSGFNVKSIMSQQDIQELVNIQSTNKYMPIYVEELFELSNQIAKQNNEVQSNDGVPNQKNIQLFELQTIDFTEKKRSIVLMSERPPKFNKEKVNQIVEFIINKIDPTVHICLVVEDFNKQEEQNKIESIFNELQNYERKYVSILIGGYQKYKEYEKSLQEEN